MSTPPLPGHAHPAQDGHGGHPSRYYFKNVGTVKELIFPNKAILAFKMNDKDEKAILLSKTLTLDGKTPEEGRSLSDYLRTGDRVVFDCHVYDKGGGLGGGRDRCNFYAMRAWKNSQGYDEMEKARMAVQGSLGGLAGGLGGLQQQHQASPPIQRNNAFIGTGWISELNPRKGVLTFDNQGHDERVLFLASRLWIFEKRLGSGRVLAEVLSWGDPVQFEAVPFERQKGNLYCKLFASVVYKGKRPMIEDHSSVTPTSSVGLGSSSDVVGSPLDRRASCSSSEGSLEANSLTGGSCDGVAALAPTGGGGVGGVGVGVNHPHEDADCVSGSGSGSGSGHHDVSTSPLYAHGLGAGPNDVCFCDDRRHDPQIIKGVGTIGKILSETTGLIWAERRPNVSQSVFFESRHTFNYGLNLSDRNLLDVFKEGDFVSFIAERPVDTMNSPCKWVAKQVQVNDESSEACQANVANLASQAGQPTTDFRQYHSSTPLSTTTEEDDEAT